MTLSVVIGDSYLAYAFMEMGKRIIASETSPPRLDIFDPRIKYGIYEYQSICLEDECINYCENVVQFLSEFNCDQIIIEKQNNLSIILQYAIVSVACQQGAFVEIFDPFVLYNVVGNESLRFALEWIGGGISDLTEVPLTQYQNRDNIADAINMIRIFLSG
jgi:hypothetical protein